VFKEMLKFICIPVFGGLGILWLNFTGFNPTSVNEVIGASFLGAPFAVATIFTMAYIDAHL
jgi:hypothetical protein